MDKLMLHTLRGDYLGIYVNCFVLETRRHNLLIDSGLRRAGARLLPWLENGKQTVLLSTHGHWDHIGMHREAQRRGAVVYAHPGDSRYYQDFDWHWQALFGQFTGDFDLLPARREVFWADIGEPAAPDQPLEDRQLLTFDGLTLEVLHTPGHSNGSVCFYAREQGWLFTGDSLMGDGFFAGVPQYCDPVSYRRSMERLSRLEPAWVFSDHSAPLPGGELAARARAGIRCSLRLERSVEEYLRAQCAANHMRQAELGAAARAMCQAEGKPVGGGACVTALAHLRLLAGEYPAARACAGNYISGN